MTVVDRRSFLRSSAGVAGGLLIAGPLQALASRTAAGAPTTAEGYGPLRNMGELSLPRGFTFEVISREGEVMSDGNPTPGIFDGMAAYPRRDGSTVLIRNHENRRRAGETTVVVPDENRYDSDPSYNAGCTKLVVARNGSVNESFAVQGGTSTNCAGGATAWRSWITCEEVYDAGVTGTPHGYAFEIPADTRGPVDAIPIRSAGRFVREAVAWHAGILYQTEDRDQSVFTRYRPDRGPRRAGDLAATGGVLEALRVKGRPNIDTATGWRSRFGNRRVGVEWVEIENPEPAPGQASTDSFIRDQALAKGAADFERQEGIWVGNDRVYFDCTSGGDARLGQIWEYDPDAQTLRLIYESTSEDDLKNPDNLTVVPETRDLILCEDADPPMFLRGLTRDGRIYDFARAEDAPESEFCGACFDPSGEVLLVNQQGNRGGDEPKVLARTYAITGPWERRRG
jgi:uncharacterized protein